MKVDIEAVRPLFQSGMNREEIARTLDVHPNALNYIIKRLKNEQVNERSKSQVNIKSDGHVLRASGASEADRILNERSKLIHPDMTFGNLVRIERPRLKNSFDEDDDRKMMNEPIGSPVGKGLRILLEDGAKVNVIRKEYAKLKRLERQKSGARALRTA